MTIRVLNTDQLIAELAERRALTERNSGDKPGTVTQCAGQTDSGLDRIHAAAKKDSQLRFNNLYHHLTLDLLTQAYWNLKRRAASGVDGVTWGAYGENLAAKLQDLHNRLRKGSYRPQPSKRVWIEKDNGKLRPIGITALEDKVVQQALSWIIQSIFETDFLGFSYGFRKDRSQHNALDAVYVAITQKKVSWVLDADIKGFFDNISHEWLMKFLGHRIADRKTLRLAEQFLKAGVEEDGTWSKTVVGTPQGSVISPLYANIYLHYVLDLWVQQWRKKRARGEVYIVRFADDFVVGFQYKTDGEQFHQDLQTRMKHFGLTLHETKTRLIEFGRFAQSNRQARGQGKPETFTFLGFVHACAQRRNDGKFTVCRKTIAKRQRTTTKRVKEELRKQMHVNVHCQGIWLSSVVRGFYNYFGVPGNRSSLNSFRTQVCRMWLRTLRKRSQKGRNYNWDKLQRLVKRYIPSAKICHPYPNQRLCV